MLSLFDQEFENHHEQLLLQFNALNKIKGPSDNTLAAFKDIINYYHHHKRRSFVWREEVTPYRVVVSEIMLQQTQTERVAQKFDPFVAAFPNFKVLAQAPLHEVIAFWKGLGYNRRAIALQKIAQLVVKDHDGQLPSTPLILETFPGIGYATARSITTFAFNAPTAFIETNIRTVFIYFFFKNTFDVHDKELMPLIEKTVDHNAPREWYYALMDYGVMLKKTVGNLCRLSKHYSKQSKFEGSDRQIRGMILQALLDYQKMPEEQLITHLGKEEMRTQKILMDLFREGFIKNKDGFLALT